MNVQKYLTGHLGVLVSNRAWRALCKNKPHYRLKQLAKANANANLNLFFFTVNTVDKKKKLIKGYYFDFTDNSWKTAIFSYPATIYRRGGVCKKERKSYRTFVRQCNKKKTLFLNPSSLGNWDIYNYFSSVKPLKPYLLQTILYEDPEDLFYMMKKHKTIYLKGVTGRKGQNVVRVERLPDNQYQCKYYDHTKRKVHLLRYKKLDQIVPFIDKFYKGKKFMVQEAIDLLEVNHRRVDLRAELQRNKIGEIEISGVSARKSKKDSPITIHANAFPLDELFDLKKLSSEEKFKMKQQIENFLYTVYKKTEDKYGQFVEIGIDFALTKDFQIKFIECNSQSAKVSLLKAHGKNTLNKAMLNIVLYAKYLLAEKAGVERKGKLTLVRKEDGVVNI
ncbi:YheC/YheD family protein [Salipaludibacillus neizhouensis]|uniref:YheC/YheD family protein n=1 Tax=Salipaludibacillus neizhouensis TaxID=885475 RepID=UPI0016014423|nr:YheC/YheD family protein [Salipaludibacillus neizhouensis]